MDEGVIHVDGGVIQVDKGVIHSFIQRNFIFPPIHHYCIHQFTLLFFFYTTDNDDIRNFVKHYKSAKLYENKQ